MDGGEPTPAADGPSRGCALSLGVLVTAAVSVAVAGLAFLEAVFGDYPGGLTVLIVLVVLAAVAYLISTRSRPPREVIVKAIALAIGIPSAILLIILLILTFA